MQEKLAMEAVKNSANMVEHTFSLPLKGKNEKIHEGEKEHAIFDDFQGMSLSESEIITMHSDKKVRIQLEMYILELPVWIAATILRKVNSDDAHW